MNIPLNIDWQQILLHALNLVLLVAGLYLLLYKPVKKFMAQREARYQGMADAAEEKTRQAQQMYDDYAGKLKGVDDEIRAKRAQEMEKTAETTREMLDDARAQADKLIAQGRENGAREKERILQSARGRDRADVRGGGAQAGRRFAVAGVRPVPGFRGRKEER